MKYLVNDTRSFSCATGAAEYIMENCDDGYYDDLLNDVYGDIPICGYEYAASVAFWRVDEMAYRVGQRDWEDSEARDIAYFLEQMDIGDDDFFFGYTVEAIADDDERVA